MADKAIISSSKLTAIADAIRSKNGSTDKYTPDKMATAIKAIETGGLSNEIVTFSQENEIAKAFVETAKKTYKDGDDYSSIIGNYSSSFPSDYQYPIGYDLTIPQAGTLLIQNESTGNGFESVSVSAGTKTIYNLIPGVTYRYILRDSNGKAYKTGRLQSTGTLRMIKVPNSWNFRDLGGWACNGGTIKYGLLLRGGPLTGGAPISDYTTDEGKRAIRDFGILQEIDLRSTGEINNGTTDTSDDIVSCAAGKYIRYNRYSASADIKTNDESSKVLAEIINLIMQNVIDGIPTYFHCSAGADRTGVIAILLEALLGVSVVDIQIDYELTYFYASRTRSTKKTDIEYLKSFNGKYSGIDWKTAVWATKYGISIDTINAFRAAAIDGSPETLAVPTKLAITQQPVDATAKVDGEVTETITATGDGLTYLWEHRTSSSGSWVSVATLGLKATETSITVGNLQTAYTGFQLRCTVTDQYGNSVVSNVATLTVVEDVYTVTNNLINCTSSNSATSIAKGSAYSATITPNSGYKIDTATVTMSGIDITSTAVMAYKINIAEITGDVVITFNASKIPATNQLPLATDASGNIYNSSGTPGYKSGYRLNSVGNESAQSGIYVSGFIPVTIGQTVKFENINLPAFNTDGNYNKCYICVYNSSHSMIRANYSKDWYARTANNPKKNDSDQIIQITFNTGTSGSDITSMAYMRISANYIGSDSKIYVE